MIYFIFNAYGSCRPPWGLVWILQLDMLAYKESLGGAAPAPRPPPLALGRIGCPTLFKIPLPGPARK